MTDMGHTNRQVNGTKTLVISGDAASFGGRNGGAPADIVVKWRSGAKWAVRVRKAGNGAVAPDPTFNPDLRATAVIGVVPPKGSKKRPKYFSARTGRELTPPGRGR